MTHTHNQLQEQPVKTNVSARPAPMEAADSYLIRSSHGRGRFFVLSGKGANGNTWGYLSVISDYGNFGHCWTNIGADEFIDFLADLKFDYAMKKLRPDYMVFDGDKAESLIKQAILSERRAHDLEPSAARELFDWITGHDMHTSRDLLLTELGHKFPDFHLDLTEIDFNIPSYDSLNFWRELWPGFLNTAKAHTHQASNNANNLSDRVELMAYPFAGVIPI